MTIVLLRGVHSPSRRGDLVRSIWNTRAWTYQEYHASKVVRFYTEDWTLYPDLDIPSHKVSPEIISEMEEATGASLSNLAPYRRASRHVFRARTNALGTVEIKTSEDLSRWDSLTLVHPWIDYLLDRHPVGSRTEMVPEENTDDQSPPMVDSVFTPGPSNTTRTVKQKRASLVACLGRPFSARPRDAASLLSPSPVSLTDKRTQALELLARLGRPFGALLFTPTRQNVAEYRRVALDGIITVQIQEDVPLSVLIDNVRMLERFR